MRAEIRKGPSSLSLLSLPAHENRPSAIIAGAGAVENAWQPVLRALQPLHDFPLTADGANSFLARLVYLLRWWSSDKDDFGRQQLELHLRFLKRIREAIAAELKEAQRKGEIKARQALETLLKKFLVPYGREFMLVTTNWDTVIKCAIEKLLLKDFRCRLMPLHIHGSVDDPDTLYLPSEMTKEPYRRQEEQQAIGTMHGNIWKGLERAQRIIIYGLSVDPLDAELGQTLACGFSNPYLEEILIVDPNHSLVAHRINLLLGRRRDVAVKGVNARTMEVEADYTVWRHKGKREKKRK